MRNAKLRNYLNSYGLVEEVSREFFFISKPTIAWKVENVRHFLREVLEGLL